MPRIKMRFEEHPRKTDQQFVNRLVDELTTDRESGQPFIYEQAFQTGKARVLVIWDDWKNLPLEERSDIIHAAFAQADGKDYRTRVALASGVTVPEGVAAGMLPYRIITAHRQSDKVTLEQCTQAMLAEGASQLFGSRGPQLRFPTEDSAEACRKRLIQKLPLSDDIWIVTQDLSAEDFV